MVKVFLTSIDSGSFTRAGEILGYTQSNLTQMMKSSEDELGISILPELTLERFPGRYDYRMLDREYYRSLGIGVRSIKEAGPLARSVINYLKDTVR